MNFIVPSFSLFVVAVTLPVAGLKVVQPVKERLPRRCLRVGKRQCLTARRPPAVMH